MIPSTLTLTKYFMQFTGDDGKEVKFDYVDVEFAPNLFVRFKLTPNNLHALERYNPSLNQLVQNIPYGSPMLFREASRAPKEQERAKTLEGIYTNSENEL